MSSALGLIWGVGGLLLIVVVLIEGWRSGSIKQPGFVGALATVAAILIVSLIGLVRT